MSDYIIPSLPLPFKFESVAIYKQLSAASRALAELKGVEETANENVILVGKIRELMQEYKQKIRSAFGAKYNHELLNNLFKHPYTKIEYASKDLGVFRHTAAKYLDELVKEGLLTKQKLGKTNYYINRRLLNLFLHQ